MLFSCYFVLLLWYNSWLFATAVDDDDAVAAAVTFAAGADVTAVSHQQYVYKNKIFNPQPFGGQ